MAVCQIVCRVSIGEKDYLQQLAILIATDICRWWMTVESSVLKLVLGMIVNDPLRHDSIFVTIITSVHDSSAYGSVGVSTKGGRLRARSFM